MSFSKNRARILPDLRQEAAGNFIGTSVQDDNWYQVTYSGPQNFRPQPAKG
ncbi:hypothetical protein HX870_08455 [Pseudomonas gingeri]|uniref:Uncharacterized protein n=1 Tax=Pseudomonas gingeri TaxID=117681 RepID=A0A7Y7X8N1_9PSED|nr:hypothetical protein [Pseudomonas gingeri]NWA26106.1 hypothetical protein [Pseudomonas gingeri]NWB95242.1 hypothetical protein [Pseudomonas gingeri]NWD67621.1 hypothetical protein [Pseudomonas gingeri]